MKLDKILLIKLLNRVWLIGATTSCRLSIAQDNLSIEADNSFAFIFNGSDLILRLPMIEDVTNPELIGVGHWDIPKLNAALENFKGA